MTRADAYDGDLADLIKSVYRDKICEHTDIDMLLKQYPIELSYALSLVDTTDYRSITPRWVIFNYPAVEFVIRVLRHHHCKEGCTYCNSQLDIHHNLDVFFGFKQFRTFEGENLQETAAQAAERRSVLRRL
jgi:ATP-dependent DNA helicase RecQ